MEIQALGGYEAIGRNMTLVKINNTQIAIDCGIRLDSFLLYYGDTKRDYSRIQYKELSKINAIPDFDLIKGKLAGCFVSHGHIDHIGALPKLIQTKKTNIYALPYPAAIIKQNLKREFQDCLKQKNYKEQIIVDGGINAEFIEITHSIPHASIVHIERGKDSLVYACDFKFDDNSRIAKPDYKRLKQIGKEGVKTLIVESLGVGEDGKTLSESVAHAKVADIIKFANESNNVIIATTFSTHIERIQSMVEAAEKCGRKVIIAGRSFLPSCSIGETLKLLNLPADTIVIAKKIEKVLRTVKKSCKDYFIIGTGHQGEPGSVIWNIVNNKYKFSLQKNDALIFASRVIPTDINIANRNRIEDKLRDIGVRIYSDAHVSGHAAEEEHRKFLSLVNPEHIIPAHGDSHMIASYLNFAESEGYTLHKNLHILRHKARIKL